MAKTGCAVSNGPVKLPAMSRRFQFSLRTMFLATTFVAVAVHWWQLWQRAVDARQGFADAQTNYRSRSISLEQLRAASDAVLRAELNVPFMRARTAWISHLERTRELERGLHGFGWLGPPPTREFFEWVERKQTELRTECEEIEARLGLPNAKRRG